MTRRNQKYAGKSLFRVVDEEGFLLLGFALLVAHSGSNLLASLIQDLVMPLVAALFSELEWDHAFFKIGEIKLRWGQSLSGLIHFTVVILIVAKTYQWLRRD